jgi:hypothetical protein
MNRIATTLLVAAALAGLGACSSGPPRQPADEMPAAVRAAPERFVVVTVRNASTPRSARYGRASVRYGPSHSARAAAEAIASDHALQEAASWPIGLLGVHCVVYALPASADRGEVLARLAADRRVESAQPLAMFTTQASAYDDPYSGLQANLALMNVAEAQQWSRGDGVRVAIVDTGVDVGHPDLAGRVAVQDNFVDDDARAFASDPHGTAVAGVIAAVANNGIGIAGIAPDVRLLLYKSCWNHPSQAGAAVCNSFTLARGIAAAIVARADIVNLSLAGPHDPLLSRIVTQGQRKGVVFVGAAPPSGAGSGFPGDVAGVITVDAPDRHSGAAARLVAPGLDVLTLVPGARYDFASGSSLAAAQASGVVALMLAASPGLPGADVARLLERTSRPVSSPAGPFVAINACTALVAVRGEGRCELRRVNLAHDRESPPAPRHD